MSKALPFSKYSINNPNEIEPPEGEEGNTHTTNHHTPQYCNKAT